MIVELRSTSVKVSPRSGTDSINEEEEAKDIEICPGIHSAVVTRQKQGSFISDNRIADNGPVTITCMGGVKAIETRDARHITVGIQGVVKDIPVTGMIAKTIGIMTTIMRDILQMEEMGIIDMELKKAVDATRVEMICETEGIARGRKKVTDEISVGNLSLLVKRAIEGYTTAKMITFPALIPVVNPTMNVGVESVLTVVNGAGVEVEIERTKSIRSTKKGIATKNEGIGSTRNIEKSVSMKRSQRKIDEPLMIPFVVVVEIAAPVLGLN
jgi:hypothetical protein